jgi:E3 ubiquitin-protein ligase RNF115/126
LFEMPARARDQQQQQHIGHDPNSNSRHINIQINDGNFASLMPQLLAQLFNPAGLAMAAGRSPQQGATASQPQPNGQPQQQPQQQQRLHFTVPGEQVDLYGIINSVFSDVLDPRRQQQQHANNFHFQSPPVRMFQLHGNMQDYAWGATGLDTIITQLLNQLENTGPPPASEDQLKSLPLVKIGPDEVKNAAQCAICYEDFALNDQAKRLPCRHHFHETCIGEWLKLHGTCPVCRKNLNGEDTSQREYIRPPETNAAAPNDDDAAAASGDGGGGGGGGGDPTATPPNPTTDNSNVLYEMDDFD